MRSVGRYSINESCQYIGIDPQRNIISRAIPILVCGGGGGGGGA